MHGSASDDFFTVDDGALALGLVRSRPVHLGGAAQLYLARAAPQVPTERANSFPKSAFLTFNQNWGQKRVALPFTRVPATLLRRIQSLLLYHTTQYI